jgi:hypothetical protein
MRWKRSLCSCTALKTRTGTLTRPNEIEPVQSERGVDAFFDVLFAMPSGSPRSRRVKHLR